MPPRWPSGWRGTITVAAVLAGTVLAANTAILAWGLTQRSRIGGSSCTAVSNAYTAWHVIINILSTLLLAASTGCMQILSAPSRAEADAAHARGRWLKIGGISVSNLYGASWKRIVTFILLGCSSVPLHFLYNSVISNQIVAYEYLVTSAYDDLFNGTSFQQPSQSIYIAQLLSLVDNATLNQDILNVQDSVAHMKYENLTSSECISHFQTGLIYNYSAVVLLPSPSHNQSIQVSDVIYASTRLGGGSLPSGQTFWICDSNLTGTSIGPEYCDLELLKDVSSWRLPQHFSSQTSSPSRWDPGWLSSILPTNLSHFTSSTYYDTHPQEFVWPSGFVGNPALQGAPPGSDVPPELSVDRCLAIEAPEKCALLFHAGLMAVIIFCNMVKLCCFVATLYAVPHHPLVTVGDGIASFLEHSGRNDGPFRHRETSLRPVRASWTDIWLERLLRLATKSSRRLDALHLPKYVLTIIVCVILICVSIRLLVEGLMHSDAELGSFSATRFQNLIEGYLNGSTASTLGDAMFVNLPQFLVSCAYLLYNSMFTDMQLAVEYTRFAQHAKALRISDPKGAQRSTYWLQLPFKYSLPLMAVMSLLHWLISEALYMVDIAFVWPDGSSDENAHVVSAGWSPFAVILATVLGTLLVLFLIISSLRPFPPGVPIMPGNTMALSGACHRSPDEGPEIVLKPLKYGKLAVLGSDGRTFEGFTSLIDEVEQVTPPIDAQNLSTWWSRLLRLRLRDKSSVRVAKKQYELIRLRDMPSVAVWREKVPVSERVVPDWSGNALEEARLEALRYDEARASSSRSPPRAGHSMSSSRSALLDHAAEICETVDEEHGRSSDEEQRFTSK